MILLLLLAVLLALTGWLLRDRLVVSRPQRRTLADLPPEALTRYLPEDTAAVVVLDARTLRQSAAVQPLLSALRHLIDYGAESEPWLAWTGIDPLRDLDEIRVITLAGDASRPLWLVRGRIDPARFEIGPGRLEPRTEEGPGVYLHTGRHKELVLLSVAGDALLCGAPQRVREVLQCAGQKPAPPVHDALLRQLLAEVDRDRPAWMAASLSALGRVGRLPNLGLELLLRPVFNHARGVTGSLAATDSLRADFRFTTANADSARQLAQTLQSVPTLAEAADLLLGSQHDLLPLLRLLETATVTPRENHVSLEGRLDASQLQR